MGGAGTLDNIIASAGTRKMSDDIELQCISDDEEECTEQTAGTRNTGGSGGEPEQNTATANQGTTRDSQGPSALPGSTEASAATVQNSPSRSQRQSSRPSGTELDFAVTNPPPRGAEPQQPAGPARNQQSSTQLQSAHRGNQERSQRNTSLATQAPVQPATRRPEAPLVDEPPPSYDRLFPTPRTSRSRPPPCQNSHHRTPVRTSQPHRQPQLGNNQIPHHTNCRCPYCSTHAYNQRIDAEVPLPGAIGTSYSPHIHRGNHSPHIITNPPANNQHEERGADDYLTLSFFCVVLCSLHLNLPALVCVLPALAYSIKAHKLNSRGRVRSASTYGRAALLCNLLAFCQYIMVVTAIVTFLTVAMVFNNQ